MARVAPALALLLVAAIAIYSRGSEPDVRAHVALLSLGGALIFAVTALGPARSAREVLIVAALMHAVALLGVPAFEDDFNRFILDGWRTLTVGTPYGTPPEAFFGDPAFPGALARTLDGVNYPEYPTIYGPTLQLVFAGAHALSQADPLALKGLFALANLGLIAFLLRLASPKQAALYAWSPLAVTEIVIHVHPDGVMALFLGAALVLAKARPAWAGVALAAAAGAKIVALAAWPLLLRLPPRALLAAGATLVALYVLFLVQGAGVGLESTSTFAAEWRFNPMLFVAISALAPDELARLAAAALGGALVLWLHWRAPSAQATPLAAIFGAVLLVAPAVNPWYLLWVLPFATTGRALWPWAAMIALPLSYLTGLNLDSLTLAPFQVHPAAWMAQVAIILAAIAYDLWRRNHARP